MMDIYIGIDDTDNKESRGTGHLARVVAEELSKTYTISGILRHQLLFDPRVPYTAKNSCAAIILSTQNPPDFTAVFNQVKSIMLEDFQTGSDPGLCVAASIPQEVIAFSRRAKVDLVHQSEARQLAQDHKILLSGLGGTEDGVIGALAAVGLASSGQDGRYISIGNIRELSGFQPVTDILNAGINSIRTLDETLITEGTVMADKLRPARRYGQPILYVQQENGHWQPLKLD
jgi:tRNA(Ile2) C34 agmatinyltransferase TiaS